MLSGVLFRRREGGAEDEIVPEFVNQYILTDVYLHAKDNPNLRRPLVPSIATLIGGSFLVVMGTILRAVALVFLSRLPGSRRAVKRISVANTAVVYHDGRALATCESGVPMRFQLPSLETVGWFNGRRAENEPGEDERTGFGGDGLDASMRECTTGHPRVDPVTKELISYHVVYTKPYVYYSIVPAATSQPSKGPPASGPRFGMPVPGVKSPKMMHDFGVAAHHTIILDLPLSLNPLNSLTGRPVISYDPTERSRFGVFPRYEPQKIQWFETNPCVIFHTANCWETTTTTTTASGGAGQQTSVHLLACRLTSAAVVYSAGALEPPPTPKPVPAEYAEEEQCRLYYYEFPLVAGNDDAATPTIRNQWALSAIPMEFPTLCPSRHMKPARYVYGCSSGSAASHRTPAKIDHLVKIDAAALIQRGLADPPQPVKGCVDTRTAEEVLRCADPEDAIKIFRMSQGWFTQEPRFVARASRDDGAAVAEDDGWLLAYAFDESQLDAEGECPEHAASELWIIDAVGMRDVVARVRLPQRVPYGLHGAWFSEEELVGQRPLNGVRREMAKDDEFDTTGALSGIRDVVERWIG